MTLPGFLTRNTRLKGVALGLALVTWAAVVYAANPPDSRTVSVHIPQDDIPAPFVLAQAIPDVSVRVVGTKEHVDAFDPGSSLVIRPDFHAIRRAGVQQLPVSIVNNDRDVSLDSAPASVTADVDVEDSVSLTVQAVVVTPPPAGYLPSTPVIDPATVAVSGPRRQLDGLTAQVDLRLGNQKTNVDSVFPVSVFDRAKHRVTTLGVAPPAVHVTMTVTPVEASRASVPLPTTQGSVAPGHEVVAISVDPLTVVLTGPQEQLNALDSVRTAPISLTGLTGTQTFHVRVTTPPGVTATPDTVTVTVTVAALPPSTPTPSPTPATTTTSSTTTVP